MAALRCSRVTMRALSSRVAGSVCAQGPVTGLPGSAVVARGLAGRRMRTIGMAGPRVCDFCCSGLGSLEHLPGDRWWLAPGEDPAGEGGGNGNAEDRDGEVEDGRVAEGAEVAEVSGG